MNGCSIILPHGLLQGLHFADDAGRKIRRESGFQHRLVRSRFKTKGPFMTPTVVCCEGGVEPIFTAAGEAQLVGQAG